VTSSASIATGGNRSAVGRTLLIAALAAQLVAGLLALASGVFATVSTDRLPADLRLAIFLSETACWYVGAALFFLAAARLRWRPPDAWAAAVLAAIVIAVASVNPAVPGPLALAATIAGALAPWLAILFPPSRRRLIFVSLNLALIVAAPAIAGVLQLPHWLRTFAPIDPLTIPSWLRALPLQWPWIVPAAPIAYGFLINNSTECCVSGPFLPPIVAYLPAAVIGAIIWFEGRRRSEKPYGWHGPAGRATRRG
jgi:hypothetical protein